MDAIERARRYFAKFPPAIEHSGGSDVALEAACLLTHGFCLSDGDAMRVLQEWSATCIPPWSQKELDHKLESALARTDHKKPRGHMLNNSWEGNGDRHQRPYRPEPEPEPALKAATYQVEGWKLPPPMSDPTRRWMRALFRADDQIFIAHFSKTDEGKDYLSGTANTRDKWIEILNRKDGDATRIWRRENDPGIYVCVNPIRPGGARKKEDITDYRYGLLEFDSVSLEEQYAVIVQSGIPCASVTYSGGKSLHALVKIMAKTEEEYAERTGMLMGHFAKYKPDKKTRDPTRLSRLPGCTRGSKCQDLLALNIGRKTWEEWEELQMPEGVERFEYETLIEYDEAKDENVLLGKGWLARGGSAVISGSSGIGKSSLAIQMAVQWARGLSTWGLTPRRPLRSLIVQAENNVGRTSKMLKGVLQGLGVDSKDGDTIIKENVVFIRDSTHTGESFLRHLRKLIKRYKPDLVWIDPLLSFIGDDISKQSVCGQFLRNWMGPIADETGVAWMIMHHSTKPSNDPKSKRNQNWAYYGAGSSELTNWARATVGIDGLGDGEFDLHFTKSGTDAGLDHPDKRPTKTIRLRHCKDGYIFWEQVNPEPKEESEPKGKAGRPSMVEAALASGMGLYLDNIAKYFPNGASKGALGKHLKQWLSDNKKIAPSKSTMGRLIDELLFNQKLVMRDDLYWQADASNVPPPMPMLPPSATPPNPEGQDSTHPDQNAPY